MVPFEEFWQRVKVELSKLPGPQPGVHVRTVRRWSQHSGDLGSDFTLIYRGGNVIHCDTATTDDWRTGISRTEFRKVYEVWGDYRSRRVQRSYIVKDLGVQNASWVIPLLHEYEQLMK